MLETGIDEGDRRLTAPWHSGLDLREGNKDVSGKSEGVQENLYLINE